MVETTGVLGQGQQDPSNSKMGTGSLRTRSLGLVILDHWGGGMSAGVLGEGIVKGSSEDV